MKTPILIPRLGVSETIEVLQRSGRRRHAYPLPDPLEVNFSSLGLDLQSLQEDIDIKKAYLAGAGAIGNALLWALQSLRIHGELNIVDFDKVEDGNPVALFPPASVMTSVATVIERSRVKNGNTVALATTSCTFPRTSCVCAQNAVRCEGM